MTTIEATTAEIGAISPVFGYPRDSDRFCLTEQCRARLLETGERLTAADGLVAIYVTESPEANYNDDPSTFGRIVALVRPLPKPPGRTIDDYPSGCVDLNERTGELVDRWPIGWPSEIVFYSEHGGPVLRDAVRTALHRSDYGAFAHQLLQGPIDLSKYAMRPLQHRLMREIRHQIARDPETQVRPF